MQSPDGEPVVSTSFWSEPLSIARPERRGEIVYASADTRDGNRLITGSWLITLEHEGADKELHLIVAVDRTEFDGSISGFSRNISFALGTLGIFLVLASWFQIRVGLRPLDKVRSEVNHVKEQTGSRLSDNHPVELVPLVHEVNDLLDHQRSTLQHARARASNLAHGLKTPLTIMRALSRDLDRVDQHEISKEIDVQVDNMQHFVERELARTRDQLPKDAWCLVAPVVERLASAFRRQPTGSRVTWQVDVAADTTCPFDEYALTELLGNLVDNALKWTRDEIVISANGNHRAGSITVADNGPGVNDEQFGQVLQRGAKLDDAPLTDAGLMIDAAALASPIKLSAGKKRHALVQLG